MKLSTFHTPLILADDTESAHATAYALAHYYTARQATPRVVCTPHHRISLAFLPQPKHCHTTVGATEHFTLRFDTSTHPIEDVHVQREESAVTITVTPKHGMIDPRDFSFATGASHYDVVIIVGAEALRRYAEDIASLHGHIPFITLPTTSGHSLGMNVYTHIHDSNNLTPSAAQCLLAAIVMETDALRTADTDVYRAGADLMARGADLQAIMSARYKNITLDFARFWGGFLESLTPHCNGRCALSIVSAPYGNDAETLATALYKTAPYQQNTAILGALWYSRKTLNGMFLCTSYTLHTILRDTVTEIDFHNGEYGTLRCQTQQPVSDIVTILTDAITAMDQRDKSNK